MDQVDFFISYNEADKYWAAGIGDWLDQAGYTTTLQAQDFVASSNFVAQMHKAVESARRMIMVLSPEYLSAPFPQAEWTAVFATDPGCTMGRLVPVRVRSCEPGGLLKPIVYIDLVDLKPEDARRRLLGEIDNLIKGSRSVAGVNAVTKKSARSRQKRASRTTQQNTINSSGADSTNIIAPNATIKVQGKKALKIQPVGTIGNDPYMKGYIAYLVKRYNGFAVIGRQSYGQKKGFHHSAIHVTIESHYGAKTYEVLQSRFEELAEDLKGRIDRTIQGKRNRASNTPNYHSFERHREIMDGGSRSSALR